MMGNSALAIAMLTQLDLTTIVAHPKGYAYRLWTKNVFRENCSVFLLLLIWLTILITVILAGAVGDGPGTANVVLTLLQTATLNPQSVEIIGWYALESLPRNYNYVIIYSPSCHSKICGWVNSWQWQYTEIIKKAPKFVSKKVLTLSNLFFNF